MMQNGTPKSIASATSTLRGHSPYCEATGPIVHEGFVAARVRAIQAKFDGIPNNTSHSPLIPCPVPSWLQITDTLTPPQSLSSGRRKGNRRRAIDTDSAAVPPPSFRPQSTAITTAAGLRGKNHAVDRSSTGIGVRYEEKNPTPDVKPKLPMTAPQYKGWPYSYHGEGDPYVNADSVTPLRPLNSAADRLVSLVDRGWTGCDVFGKAYSDCRTSDNYDLSEQSQKSLSNDRNLQRKHPKEALPVHGHLYPEVSSIVHHQHQAAKANSHSEVHTLIDSPKFDRSQFSEMENSRPSDPIQAKTRRHDRYFADCESGHPGFEKPTLSQEIDRHLSQWENTRILDGERSESADVDTANLQSGDQLRSPSVARREEDDRLTKTIMQQSREHPTRSASWFSRLAGLKLALIDRAPIIQVLSRRTSEPAIGSAKILDHYQHEDDVKQGTPPVADEEISNGHEALSSKSMTNYHLPKSGALKVPAESSLRKGNTMGVPMNKEPVSRSDDALQQTLSSTSDSPFHSHGVPLSILSTAHDNQEHSFTGIDNDVPSDSPSATRKHNPTSDSGPTITSTSRAAQRLQDIRSEISDSGYRTQSNHAEGDECQIPEKEPPRFQPAIIAHPIENEAGDTKRSAQWEVAGNGRGIKRVQVIVSLDGADDLMIDAKLLTTHEKNAGSRIEEEAESLRDEQLSDYSGQGFF